MILIVAIAIVFSISHFTDLPAKLSAVTPLFHHFCLQMLPRAVENHGSLEALVCGKNMHELELQQFLVQSSLIHIFIVSGSHFLLLHKVLARIPIVRFWTLFVLCLYCLATLCQPPAVRSLLFLVLASFTKRRKLFASPIVLVFLSGVFTVCIFPQWITSRSLLMSLFASLVLAVMSQFWSKERDTLPALFITQAAVYFVMSFCLWGFSNLHPLGILMNLALGPFIGGVIFPLALLIVFVPPASFLFDFAMNALTWILRQSSELLSERADGVSFSIVSQWLMFAILLTSSYIYIVWAKRQKARRV